MVPIACSTTDLLSEFEKSCRAHEEFRKRHPILSGIVDAWKNFREPGPLWWLRYRLVPRHRYHIVRTRLSPGYHDPSSRILYAVFGELDAWVQEDWHTDGYLVSGRIALPKEIVGERAGASYETGDPATEEDIAYYLSRKDMIDDLREAYLWWIKTGRDPERWIETQCWDEADPCKIPDNVYERQEAFAEESAAMLVKVVAHYRNLSN